jgi:uncharacterized membrane protein YhaH (DUF805 family)
MPDRPPAPAPLLDDVDASPWRVLLDPRGRVGRRTWWWYGVALPLAVGLMAVLLGDIARLPAGPVEAAVNALLLWPALAVSIKRWHDRDRSGWWVLVLLLPVVGWVWTLVVNGLMPGTPGRNRYGAVPGSAGADAFGLPRG